MQHICVVARDIPHTPLFMKFSGPQNGGEGVEPNPQDPPPSACLYVCVYLCMCMCGIESLGLYTSIDTIHQGAALCSQSPQGLCP